MINIRYISIKMASITAAYFIAIAIFGIIQANDGASNSLFDYIINPLGSGSAGSMSLILGVMPCMVVVLPILIDKIEKDTIILRLRQKKTLFYHHFTFSVFASLFFMFVMMFSGLCASLVLTGHITNLWGTESGSIYFYLDDKMNFPQYVPFVTSAKIWLYLLSSRFLAILFLASSIIMLKLLCKRNFVVCIIAILLFSGDAIFSKQFSLFAGRANIGIETLVSPNDQLFNLCFFTLGIILCSYICSKLYDKKEFYD